MSTAYRKKLIEVALPLKAINEASAREKSIRHGHPSTLHLWWARRPLAACRAVLFASLVDDPDSDPVYRRADGSVDEDRAGLKRAELFNLIEELVKWENSNNPRVINAARAEIARCVASRKIELGELAKDTIIVGPKKGHRHPKGAASGEGVTAWDVLTMKATAEVANAFLAEYAPPVLDPFCGGGSIPLEAQRLGLRAYGSDLNPVPVLITKALIEIPPKFAGRPPVHPPDANEQARSRGAWNGAEGLAEDVRYYGKWMRDEAEKRIGHLYPKVKVTKEMARNRPDLEPYVGQELTVIAWLWARTVASPNPAVGGAHVPLVHSFWLSTKKGKEAWVRPVVDRRTNTYHFEVGVGKPPSDFDPGTGTIGRKGGRCTLTGAPMSFPHVRSEAKAGRMGARLMAIVAEGARGRIYLSPQETHVTVAQSATQTWRPEGEMPKKHRNFQPPVYGMNSFGDLFTPRQLVALTTFSDLVQEVRAKVLADARGSGLWPDGPLADNQVGRDGQPPVAKGYYRRGSKHPPHWDEPGQVQHVTFRLAGTLPNDFLSRLQQQWESKQISADEYQQGLNAELDRGMGPDWLKQPPLADIVQQALEHFDGQRYDLYAWCIMPNHVHVLFGPRPGHRLPDILHSWKSFTAKECNKRLGRTGAFWQDDYFDRAMRDEDDFARTAEYILHHGGRASSPTLLRRIHLMQAQGSALQSDEAGSGCAEAKGRVGPEAQPPTKDRVGPEAQPPAELPLAEGGTGPQAYADAVATYLAFGLSKCCNLNSTLTSWMSDRGAFRETFARQALPMVWDFAEANPFSGSGGNMSMFIDRIADAVDFAPAAMQGVGKQLDATAAINGVERPTISTDPPYYDNIGYADLSDFFYVWLRRSLKPIYPSLFATALTPKAQELIASPYRHDGDKRKAQDFFEAGLGQAFTRMHEAHAGDYPLTVYYAFKQSETEEDRGDDDSLETQQTASTGWETMLAGLIRSGFAVTGTWPMRTESPGRAIARGTNALASSIILVCRPRLASAALATRKEYISALRTELPNALRDLQHGSIAPVDLAQSAIGPGMAVFTRYTKVIESDGSPMTVRTALGIINQVLDEVLAEQEGDFDADTRWALAWFDQFGVEEGQFGVAETLSKAKNTAVNALVEAGIVKSKAGKVRLLRRDELPDGWDPATDTRLRHWEVVQHLIRTLETKGEAEAAKLLNRLGGMGETARELAYRLYSICERKKWAEEALAYNSLVIAWPELSRLALSSRNRRSATQQDFGF